MSPINTALDHTTGHAALRLDTRGCCQRTVAVQANRAAHRLTAKQKAAAPQRSNRCPFTLSTLRNGTSHNTPPREAARRLA